MAPDPRRLSAKQRKALRGKSARVRALAQAKLYVGVHEIPAGSNRGPHIDRWCRWATADRFPGNRPPGITGYPWCAAFACGMIREVSGLVVPEPRQAAVGFLEAWARSVGSLLRPGTRPRRGDWIIYRFDSDDWPDHIGIVDRVYAISWRGSYAWGRVRTIEGNTASGNDANGGRVEVRWRSISRARFVRVDARKLKRP